MIARREAGEPLEYIVGWAEFCGTRMVVAPGVFVPRHRTEFLVDVAGGLLTRGGVVLDLCCGSGAVGAVLAASHRDIELVASDIDPDSVAVARRNVGDRGLVVLGNLFDALPPDLAGRVTVLVANAPYVPTAEIALMPPEARDHEARVTLDGGFDGLDVHREIAAHACEWLAPGGHLLIEVSDRQADSAAELFTRGGLVARIVASDEGDATVVVGLRAV